MAGEVMKGLFGLDPLEVSMRREREASNADAERAVAIARLDPYQQASAMGMMSGAQIGRGITDLGRTVLGGVTGKDLRPQDIRMAELMQQMGPELSQLPPEQRQAALAQRLLEQGMGAGVPMSQDAYSKSIADLKTQMEARRAQAAAAKDVVDAQAKLQENPLISKIDVAKFSPGSVAKFNGSKNFADLEPVTSGTSPELESLYTRWKRDPNALNDTEQAKLFALGKQHWGAEFMNTIFNPESKLTTDQKNARAISTLAAKANRTPEEDAELRVMRANDPLFKNLTDEQSKTLLFTDIGNTAWNLAKDTYGPVFKGEARAPVSYKNVSDGINKLDLTDPKKTMTLEVGLAFFGFRDPVAREYISDMMGVAYPQLRKETGAAISEQEWAQTLNQFVPFKEDSPTAQKNKIARLQSRIVGMNKSAKMIPSYERYGMSPLNLDDTKKPEGQTAPNKAAPSLSDIEAAIARKKGN